MRKSTKEEAEKKEIPPSPPIGRKGEEEKVEGSSSGRAPACACACAREGDTPEPSEGDLPRRPQIPPREGQLAAARNLGIPESYLDLFLADLKQTGYQYVNPRGSLVTLNRSNFSAILGSFYKQHSNHPEAGLGKGRSRVKRPDNWVGMDDATRVILSESHNIENPAAFLTTQFAAELSLGDYRGNSLVSVC